MTERCGSTDTSSGDPCKWNVEEKGECPFHDRETPPDSGRDSKLTKEREEQIAQAIEQGKSLNSAASRAGVTPQTVYNWLNKGETQDKGIHTEFFEHFQDVWYDEYDHSTHCSKIKGQKYSGEDSWNWKNNNRSYRGPNWHRQRKKALERADYKCENCAVTDKEHRRKYDYGLHVHHIIPRATFADHDAAQNELTNLCVLCHSCHGIYEGTQISPVQRGEA